MSLSHLAGGQKSLKSRDMPMFSAVYLRDRSAISPLIAILDDFGSRVRSLDKPGEI